MEDRQVNFFSSCKHQWTYDVFLSFRGEDTRRNFTGNLYNALRQKGIHTFMDDQELIRGRDISATLVKAIEQSRISIIIFSENYASSSWCLDELVNIVECMKIKGQLVWPVFYEVHPSTVRHQRGSFERAIAKFDRRLGADSGKVEKWRLVLNEVANLSGFHFRNGYEFEFIQQIIEEISSTLNHSPLFVADHSVGLESRIHDFSLLLDMGSYDVQMIGICGFGGIGKTTLAQAMYNVLADQFDGACFLADVGENSSKRGLVQLQEEFLAEILGDRNIKLYDVSKGISIIKRRLHSKKVLLILDNVQKLEHLRKLAGGFDWFGPGSRILITARDKHLLVAHGVEVIHEVKELNYYEAFELFSWHAFGSTKPEAKYVDIARRLMRYANGIPLVLEIIGSNLRGKGLDEWMSALEKYKRIPLTDIQNIFKISYDDLEEDEREIFLDLAFFFNGEKLEYVEEVLDASGFHTKFGIERLVDKYLVKIILNKIKIHDLIQDMAREIVRQTSRSNPSKRSRLWNHDEIFEVLTNDAGTDEIEGIILEFDEEQEVQWSGEAFKKMPKLRILIVRNALFSRGPTYLPNSLRLLEWSKYPSPSLPEDFHPSKLVAMHLPFSRLTLAKPFKEFKSLTRIDFTDCDFLTQVPDMSAVSNLIKLRLDCCINLVKIDDSVGYLNRLVTLSTYRCPKLRSLPREIKLMSLEHLDISRCYSLKKFPDVPVKMENIRTVDLRWTAIEESPSSMGNLFGLRLLQLSECSSPSNLASVARDDILGPREDTGEDSRCPQDYDFVSNYPIVGFLENCIQEEKCSTGGQAGMRWDPMETECNMTCQKDQLDSNEMVGFGPKYQIMRTIRHAKGLALSLETKGFNLWQRGR